MSERNVVATIEARMGSTRFPGKTLCRLGRQTLLEWTVNRLKMCRKINGIIVATSVNPGDDPIASMCEKIHVPFFRGSEEDVLSRVSGAVKRMNGDIVVQAGADCPFYDPLIIDQMIEIYRAKEVHYVCNDLEEGYPIGVNLHVFSSKTLYEIEKKAVSPRDRENIVTFIWDHPEAFTMYHLSPPMELNRPDIRLTVDYPEDLEFLTKLISGIDRDSFNTRDIIKYLEVNPHLLKINSHLKMKKGALPFTQAKII